MQLVDVVCYTNLLRAATVYYYYYYKLVLLLSQVLKFRRGSESLSLHDWTAERHYMAPSRYVHRV